MKKTSKSIKLKKYIYLVICVLTSLLINTLLWSMLGYFPYPNFSNIVFRIFLFNLIIIGIYFIPFTIIFIFLYKKFLKNFTYKTLIILVTILVISAPIIFLLFLDMIVVHNDCKFKGVLYKKYDPYPGDQTLIPGTNTQFCKCYPVDGNNWMWMCGD